MAVRANLVYWRQDATRNGGGDALVEVGRRGGRTPVSAAIRALLATILIVGCATGQPEIKGSVPLAEVAAACESAVASGDGGAALRSAFEQAGLLGLYLALRGAAEGAWWGAVTGGSAADGAWIGAAAGAGLGMIIGVGVGVHRGLEAHRNHRAAYEGCLAAPLTREDAAPPGAEEEDGG
jgi:hypothetical protein